MEDANDELPRVGICILIMQPKQMDFINFDFFFLKRRQWHARIVFVCAIRFRIN